MTEAYVSDDDEPPFDANLEQEWSALYSRTQDYLSNQGMSFGPFTNTDFWIVDEHYELSLLQVETTNLDLIHPRIVEGLRSILQDHPAFLMTLKLVGKSGRPGMGIIIRQDKILDQLLRDHLPTPYKDFVYS